MNFRYQPPASNPERDQSGSPITRSARGYDDQNEMRIFNTKDPNVKYVELWYRTFAEGLDLMTVSISPGAFTGKLAKIEGLDARKGRQLILAVDIVRTTL